jgi:hypothetical protein
MRSWTADQWINFGFSVVNAVLFYYWGWFRGQAHGYQWDKRTWRTVPQKGVDQ